jgi:dihydrodipicolinate synthase/N-acetylneuraminate lyase
LKPTGVIVPLVTPLDNTGQLDRQGLRHLIEYVIAGGVDGIFVAGTTGECSRLSTCLRHALFDCSAEYCRGRVPLYAGVMDSDIETVLDHCTIARTAGADYIVATLPYYLPAGQIDEGLAWFQAILDANTLPLVLYEIPPHVGYSISAEVLSILAPHIAGIKDSSNSAATMAAYLAALAPCRQHTAYLCGSEPQVMSVEPLDVDGVVPSMANVFPQLWSALWHNQSDVTSQHNLMQAYKAVAALNGSYANTNSLGDVAWKKTALEQMGICRSYLALPGKAVTDDGRIAAVTRTVLSLVGQVQLPAELVQKV